MAITLRQRTLNALENLPKKQAEEIAKKSGYSSKGALVKVLEKEKGDIEGFAGFVRVVHELFPETKFELMSEFARTLSPQTLTSRFMLEYADLYNQKELRKYLIEELSKASNKESNDWAFVYEMDQKVSKKQIEPFEAVNQLSQRSYKSVDMKVYSKIVQFYAFYDMRNIYMMQSLYQTISEEINLIKQKFTKTSFMARLFLIEADVRLHNKEIGGLREQLFLVEEALDPIKSYVYGQVANSYMMTNYDKAKSLLLKGLECSSAGSKYQISQSLNFLAILWDKFEDFKSDGTLSNEFFYYAKKGDELIAKAVLKKIDFDKLTPHQQAFNLYYQGILFKDETLFCASLTKFDECGEKFYKALPIMELKKMGVKDHYLQAMGA